MKTLLTAAAAVLISGGAALAGDAANGEKIFGKACKTCHAITSPAGEEIVKGGKTGPNQWGVIGRAAGTSPGFERYGDAIKAVGAAGLVWSEEEIVAYLEDPRAYLQAKTGDKAARSNMAYKLKDPAERADVAAYLAQFK
jgi:cytochrome c